ncbi:MAG: Alanine racemase 1 [Ignavibacteria bacterium]|nr:Alanine racemase 1 [Ignavibacteria bacterium]
MRLINRKINKYFLEKRFFTFKKNFSFLKKIINDTYAEINLSTLRKNFEAIKKYAGRNSDKGKKICSIVKANAYGHGMNEIAKALLDYGTDYLGTANYSESIELHDYFKKNTKKQFSLLCLGILTENGKFFEEIIKRKIEVTVSDIKIAGYLNDYAKGFNKKINIQIKADTGMNRIGFPADSLKEAVRKLKTFGNLNIKGIFSHFAESENAKSGFSLKQIALFKQLIKESEDSGFKFELKHICNTGGILNFNDPEFNMVRPGISLYGYYPEIGRPKKEIGISPVMTLKSKVSQLKTVDKNVSISYGRKYITKRKTRIASIPVGYGDGYPRLLTGKSKILINKKFYKVSGTICMDWILSDVGKESSVSVNDEVILFGRDLPADEPARLCGMIPYEILCGVSSRVQRVYV